MRKLKIELRFLKENTSLRDSRISQNFLDPRARKFKDQIWKAYGSWRSAPRCLTSSNDFSNFRLEWKNFRDGFDNKNTRESIGGKRDKARNLNRLPGNVAWVASGSSHFQASSRSVRNCVSSRVKGSCLLVLNTLPSGYTFNSMDYERIDNILRIFSNMPRRHLLFIEKEVALALC